MIARGSGGPGTGILFAQCFRVLLLPLRRRPRVRCFRTASRKQAEPKQSQQRSSYYHVLTFHHVYECPYLKCPQLNRRSLQTRMFGSKEEWVCYRCHCCAQRKSKHIPKR